MALTVSIVQANNSDGIFVTYNGSEYCYKLTEMPTITYVEENDVKYAKLTLNDVSVPILTIELKKDVSLEIIYGSYSTEIKNVNSKVTISTHKGKKYIIGGKLIILDKYGNQNNLNGLKIK